MEKAEIVDKKGSAAGGEESLAVREGRAANRADPLNSEVLAPRKRDDLVLRYGRQAFVLQDKDDGIIDPEAIAGVQGNRNDVQLTIMKTEYFI